MKLHILISCSIMAVFLFACSDHSNDFSRSTLNNGIQVSAPDGWRWARSGIERESVLILAGSPKSDYDRKNMLKDELETWEYDTEINGAVHKLLFNRDGYVSFFRWYEGISADDTLRAPNPTVNKKLVIDFPRCVPMAWDGASSNGYQVEAQVQYPGGSWSEPKSYFTQNKVAVHQHTGANDGRWRVRKLSLVGYGPWSDYVEFSCSR